MEFRQCFQCKNDLPNTSGPEVVPCLFCGAVNEAPPAFKVKDTPKPLRRSQFSSSGSVDFTSFCNRSGGNDSRGNDSSGGE